MDQLTLNVPINGEGCECMGSGQYNWPIDRHRYERLKIARTIHGKVSKNAKNRKFEANQSQLEKDP